MARLNQIRLAILLVIFCLLAFYVWFPATSQQEAPADPAQTLLPVDTGLVTEITILYKGQRPALTLRKIDSVWRLIKPRQGRADPKRVRDLLAVFQYGFVEVVGRADQGLQAFGLDSPEITMWLTRSEQGRASRIKIAFGPDSPSRSVCYCRVEGDPRVFTVGVLYKRELEKEPSFYLQTNP